MTDRTRYALLLAKSAGLAVLDATMYALALIGLALVLQAALGGGL